MVEGFTMLTWTAFLFAGLGVVICSAIMVMPGLGGPFVIAVLIPFTYAMSLVEAVAFLSAAVVVTGTANTITSCLFGVPGSATGVATVFDGYPMAQRGEGGRAVSAGLFASLLGGLFGALCLALVLPVARWLVLNFGPSEFLVLIFLALCMIASMVETKSSKGFLSALLGFMVAFVGMHIGTAELRFTFNQLYLYDGIQLVPMVMGLFAVAEMMDLGKKRGAIADAASSTTLEQGLGLAGLRAGIKDTFVSWRVTLMGSVMGVIVGATPGLGSPAAQYLAYARGSAVTRRPIPFGKGNVDGVIASDAATNSKEGGALIPTLLFGIPGSPVMAILLAVFITIGISPGPRMVTDGLPVIWMIVWLIVLANIMATVLSMAVTIPLSRLTTVPAHWIIPAVVAISLWGSYMTSRRVGDLLVLLGFSVLGYVFKRYGYSRMVFVIAVVLAPLFEHYWLLTESLYGWTFIYRPFTLMLLGLAPMVILWRRYGARGGRRAAKKARAQ